MLDDIVFFNELWRYCITTVFIYFNESFKRIIAPYNSYSIVEQKLKYLGFNSLVITNNDIGFVIAVSASNNKIYHNNFLDNNFQAYDYSINTWDIPKGRRNGPEKMLNCAIRETAEETGVYPSDYHILDEEPLTLVQLSPNVRYESYYYIAVIDDHKYNPHVQERMGVGKPSEITEIQWMTMDKVSVIDPGGKIFELTKKAITIVRSKYKYDRLLRDNLI